MRLRLEYVEFLSGVITKCLLEDKYIITDNPNHTQVRVKNIILEDLEVEEDLDDEVHDILEEYEDELERQDIPYHEMFKLIKAKLIKERGLII